MYERPRRRQLTILAALLAASIVLITIDFRQPDGGPVERLQRLAIAVFGPLQQGASAVVRPVEGLAGGVSELGGLRERNRRLEAEVARLRAQERTYGDVLGENRRLRGALAMARRCGCRTVGASVVASSGSNFQLSVTVDAGSRQGVTRDMAVVDADGLVGRVTQVTADYAIVLLVTDPASGVAATLAQGPAWSNARSNTRSAPHGDPRSTPWSKAPGIVRGGGTQLLSFQPSGPAPRSAAATRSSPRPTRAASSQPASPSAWSSGSTRPARSASSPGSPSARTPPSAPSTWSRSWSSGRPGRVRQPDPPLLGPLEGEATRPAG